MECIETDIPQEKAAQLLTDALKARASTPTLLMLSGGSAFSILQHVPSSVFGPHVTLAVLDERFSTEPTVHNFTQLEASEFFSRAIGQGTKVISTKILDGESLVDVANRFATALHEWREQHPTGVVVATMGIGPDGHTAGIFAGEYGVDFDGPNWVVGYTVPQVVHQYTERVTVTKTFLREVVDVAIVYAVGLDKRRHVQALCAASGYDTIPASVLRDMQKVVLVTGAHEAQ